MTCHEHELNTLANWDKMLPTNLFAYVSISLIEQSRLGLHC